MKESNRELWPKDMLKVEERRFLQQQQNAYDVCTGS